MCPYRGYVFLGGEKGRQRGRGDPCEQARRRWTLLSLFAGSSLQARCLTWLNSLPCALTWANWKRSSTSMRTNWRILSRTGRKGIFSTVTTRFFHGTCFSHLSVLFNVSFYVQMFGIASPRSPPPFKWWACSKQKYKQRPQKLLVKGLWPKPYINALVSVYKSPALLCCGLPARRGPVSWP